MRLLLKRCKPQSSIAKIILHEIPFGVATHAFFAFYGTTFVETVVLTKLKTCSFVILNLPLADRHSTPSSIKEDRYMSVSVLSLAGLTRNYFADHVLATLKR